MCAQVLNKVLLVPLLLHGRETMVWKEKERSRIRSVQMDNVKRFVGYLEIVLNA